MNCTEFLDLFNSYLDDNLEEQSRAEVEAHLADCPDCNCEAVDWQTCLDWLRKTFPEQAPPVELWRKIQAAVETQ
jgi:anti-sigma factor RsiW